MRFLFFSYLRVLHMAPCDALKTPKSFDSNPLLVILLTLLVDNVEESELINTLGCRDDTKPVTELLLLEELLCQVLEVSARELGVCDNLDLSLALLGDLDGITEVSNTAVDLDLVLEELLEGGDVEDLVACGLRSVDDELLSNLGLLALGAGFL